METKYENTTTNTRRRAGKRFQEHNGRHQPRTCITGRRHLRGSSGLNPLSARADEPMNVTLASAEVLGEALEGADLGRPAGLLSIVKLMDRLSILTSWLRCVVSDWRLVRTP